MATSNPTESRVKPRIAFFSYSGLSRLAYSIIPEYSDEANIIVFNKAMEDAVDQARTLMEQGNTNVLLSAGANADYLNDLGDIPLIRIDVTGTDLMRALFRARRVSDRIAVVSYKQKNPELDEIAQLLDFTTVEQRTYNTLDDARETFHELATLKFKAVIGSSIVTEMVQNTNMAGILVYSRQSVREAIERAIEIAKIQYAEEQRTKRINTILTHLSEGVIAVDREENIQLINPAMGRLSGLDKNRSLHKKLGSLKPSLSLAETVQSGEVVLEKIVNVGSKTLVTNRIPVRQNNVITGAIITVQDANVIARAASNLRSRNRRIKHFAKYNLDDIIGTSIAMERARSLCRQYAVTNSTVLITGPTGTGKELFAQGIHNASDRKDNPFVAVNCSAIPETLMESELFGYSEGAFTGSKKGGQTGQFELAHTGTIFLDEISEIPLPLQTRLLRVLQEKEIVPLGGGDPIPINVRVIAATNRDLNSEIREGNFRQDLYYRLNILQIRLPTLSERSGDILLLAHRFIADTAESLALQVDAERLLSILKPAIYEYTWPGNVRELENIIERVVVLYSDPNVQYDTGILPLRAAIPEFFADSGPTEPAEPPTAERSLKAITQNAEHQTIQEVLDSCNGNMTKAAKQLNLSRTTLWRKLKAFNQE